MATPSDDEIIKVSEEMGQTFTDAFGAPSEFGTIIAALGIATSRIMESDCECDGCVSIRGSMMGIENAIANQG